MERRITIVSRKKAITNSGKLRFETRSRKKNAIRVYWTPPIIIIAKFGWPRFHDVSTAIRSNRSTFVLILLSMTYTYVYNGRKLCYNYLRSNLLFYEIRCIPVIVKVKNVKEKWIPNMKIKWKFLITHLKYFYVNLNLVLHITSFHPENICIRMYASTSIYSICRDSAL